MAIGGRLGELAAAAALDEPGGPGDVGLPTSGPFENSAASSSARASLARQREHDGQRLLLRAEVAPGRLAGHLRPAPDAEQVVDGLERETELAAERRRARRRRASSASESERADRRRAREQRAGLRGLHLDALVERRVDAGLERHVGRLAGDHRVGRARQRGRAARRGERARLEQHAHRERLERVADDDRLADAEERPHGRAVTALAVAVDHVVVQQREVVDELDGDRARHADRRERAGRLGREDRQRGPDALAAAARRRVALLVGPAQVVADRRLQLRRRRRTASRSAGSVYSRARSSTAGTVRITPRPPSSHWARHRPCVGSASAARSTGDAVRSTPRRGAPRRGVLAAAHRALHRRRPPGVGPRAGEEQAADAACARRRAERARCRARRGTSPPARG